MTCSFAVYYVFGEVYEKELAFYDFSYSLVLLPPEACCAA